MLSVLATLSAASAQQPFTLQQALSAPYSTSLTAAPKGALFAWVEDAEGRHNLWVGGPETPARQLTHNTQDDAQDIAQLAWSPDAESIAYTYGAEIGASGQPANPAHLQRPTALQVIVQSLGKKTAPISIPNARRPFFLDTHTLLFLREGKIWTTELTSNPSPHQLVYDRGSASSLTLSPDGKLLAYVSTRRQSGHPSHSYIALYDLSAHTLRFVSPATDVDSAPAFSPDGKQLAWLRRPFTETLEFETDRVSAMPWSIQLCDLTTNTTRTLYSPEPNKYGSVLPRMATGDPYLLFPSSDRVLFFSEADGWVHLYSVRTKDGKPPVSLTSHNGEIEDATLSSDKRRVYFSSTGTPTTCEGSGCTHAVPLPESADIRSIWQLSLDTDQGPVPMTPTSIIATHPVALSNDRVAGLISTASEPMHPAILSSKPAPPETLQLVEAPMAVHPTALPANYPADRFVIPKQVRFNSSDGIHLHGQIFEPNPPKPVSGKRAALIFVHGGPKRQMLLGYPSMDYYSNAYAMNQYLASRGFVVLSVNYRCGIGYGLEFRQCENSGASGGTEYNDVLAAVNYLRARPDVDPKRIGIWGGSYGGYLTALALARNSDLFAAGVDFHGVHDWILEDNRDDWLEGTNAQKDDIAAKAHAASPLNTLDHWRSPVLLIHGDDDPEVAYAQTPTLADQLRAHDIPMEELVFPDEVHGFLLHKDWLAAYEAEAAFFERLLKP